jgi:hypothetical protein
MVNTVDFGNLAGAYGSHRKLLLPIPKAPGYTRVVVTRQRNERVLRQDQGPRQPPTFAPLPGAKHVLLQNINF